MSKIKIPKGSRPECSRCKNIIMYAEYLAAYGGDPAEYFKRDYIYLCTRCHEKEFGKQR